MKKDAIIKLLPKKLRHFLWKLKPNVYLVNTLALEKPSKIDVPIKISDRYVIKVISLEDEDKLKKFFSYKGPNAYKRKVPKRLKSKNYIGYAVFERSTGDIVYNSWAVHNYEDILKEYSEDIISPSLYWESAECLPNHRHQGFHSRIEQEIINYTYYSGLKALYIHIENKSTKGIEHALNTGFTIKALNNVIFWPIFNIYRNFDSFKKKPFKKFKIYD